MKPLFILVFSKSEVDKYKILEISKQLPKNIAIAYSIQYKAQAEQIRKLLSKSHKINQFAQVLGCSKPKIPKSTRAIILISDGRFHAISLAIEINYPIYIYESNKLSKISDKEIGEMRKKQKASYVKFLSAKKVGILVSAKPGQQNLKKAIELKQKLKLKDKQPYIIIGDNLNSAEFENFPDIQSWVNTACPRLDMNSRIVNINNLKSSQY